MSHSILLLASLCLFVVACSAAAESNSAPKAQTPAQAQTPTPASASAQKPESKPSSGLYAMSAPDIDGKTQPLSKYTGKVTLVVNTASQCGYTPQYEGLEKLYTELAPKGFVILGFPSNDFGGQEPGSAQEIKTFCSEKYSVNFPLFAKIGTKAGADQSPIYGYLGGETGKLPSWNFCKYLVGKDGKVIDFYPSKVRPDDAELRKAIDAALAAS
jgi:glutathione peroxidase